MSEQNDRFTREDLDQVIDESVQGDPALPEVRLLQDLQRAQKARDRIVTHATEHVWQRLQAGERSSRSAERNARSVSSIQLQLSIKKERKGLLPMKQTPQHSPSGMLQKKKERGLLTTLAAVLLTGLLIGAFVIFLQLSRAKAGQTAAPRSVTQQRISSSRTYCTATWTPSQGAPGSISWSSSQDKLALPLTPSIQIMDATTCKHLPSYTPSTNSTWDALWSPDGKRLASYDSQEVQILDSQTLKVLSRFRPGSTAQGQAPSAVPLTFLSSANGGLGKVYASAWSSDGAQIASLVGVKVPLNSPGSGEIEIWNTATGQYVRSLSPRVAMGIQAIIWSPGGRYIAVADGYDAIRVWDAHTGTLLFTIHHKVFGGGSNTFAWSADDAYLAFNDGTATRIWNVQSNTLAFSLDGRATSIAWSTNSKYIATAYTDVRIWDAQSHKLVYTYTGHHIQQAAFGQATAIIQALAFAPDSKRLASLAVPMAMGGPDPTLKVWSF